MNLQSLHFLYGYNAWATERVLESLEAAGPEVYVAPGCSGHGTVQDTLAHLLSVQQGWIGWFDGSLSIAEAIQPLVVAADVPTVAAAREKWADIARQTDAYIEGLTEDALREDVSWAVPGGPSGVTPRWQFLLHLADHGTHTPGQIVAAIRRAGHPPANVGIVRYILSQMTMAR